MVRCIQGVIIYLSEATVEDRVSAVNCLQEREIEDFVRGKLSLDEEKLCQTHCLWCQTCQSLMEEESAFADATRGAAAQLAQDEAATVQRTKS